MGKKWWIAVVAIIALAIGLAVAIPAIVPPSPGVNYANYSRIEKGMTREQVEAILGKPSTKIRDRVEWPPMVRVNGDAVARWSHWQNESDDLVSIPFDENDRVIEPNWNGTFDDRSTWEILRDRLPWLAKEPPAQPLITID